MCRMAFLVLASVVFGLSAGRADAHYPMLLPSAHSIKRGEHLTLTYQWGHPYEHQLFDALVPDAFVACTPGGSQTIDLKATLKQIALPAGEGKTVMAYQAAFSPQERGDYLFYLELPALWMEEEQEFFQDVAYVVVHVQAQRGWDNNFFRADDRMGIQALTRPYGLRTGMAFQALVSGRGKGLANTLVEVEHYNETPPASLPPDENITRSAKTDPNGVVTCTLTDPGWTCVAAVRSHGKNRHGEKEYPVRQRAVFWVYVDR
jgi:uncharacterized GH25 family protein